MSEPQNIKCVLRQSDYVDDWYILERAEHDGRSWLEPMEDSLGNTERWCCSARLDKRYCIEGTTDEWRAIALAIEGGTSVSFKRCAARKTARGYEFTSPRNSEGEAVLLTFESAAAVAEEIRRVVGS